MTSVVSPSMSSSVTTAMGSPFLVVFFCTDETMPAKRRTLPSGTLKRSWTPPAESVNSSETSMSESE